MSESSYQEESPSDASPIIKRESDISDGESKLPDTESDQESELDGAPIPRTKRAFREQSNLASYRNLLNSVIEEANSLPALDDGSGPLHSSQIGASFWTSDEKERFFAALSLHGTGGLPDVATAVGTKSLFEIQAYLRLLEDGAREAKATFPTVDGLSQFVAFPAALEISAKCETALESAAGALRGYVEKSDTKIAKNELGTDWLIDEEAAQRLDDEFDDENSENSESENERTPVDNLKTPLLSTHVLHARALLELSRNIFMNGPLDTGNNWRDIVTEDAAVQSPAIMRRTFDDFYNLIVSVTRRLVQASLFQAMSRLRAGDGSRANWQPQPTVTAADVIAAVEILGMQLNGRESWAKAARRCNVDVYTETKKFEDGRPATRNGVLLTCDEVEAELGFGASPVNEEGMGKIDVTEETDDDSTSDTSENHSSLSEANFDLASGDDDEKLQSSRSTDSDEELAPAAKRKRVLSPTSVAQAEEKYLQNIDDHASRGEERGLWEMLGASPPGTPKTETDAPLPLIGRQNKEFGNDNVADWRKSVQYQAEWERDGNVSTHNTKRRSRAHAKQRTEIKREP